MRLGIRRPSLPKIDGDHPDDCPVVTVTLNELGEHGEKTAMIFQLVIHFADPTAND